MADQVVKDPRLERIQPTDVVAFRLADDLPVEARRQVMLDVKRAFMEAGHRNLLLFFPAGFDLTVLDPDEMRRCGWVRAEPALSEA